MIRPYAQPLRRHPLVSLAIILLWALTFVLPGLLVMGAVTGEHATRAWLEGYQPVLYLTPQAPADQVQALVHELEAWPGVAQVSRREPAQARALLVERLGAEEVQRLGITEAMMPTSLLIQARVPLMDHVSIISRVASLQAREGLVASVDVPSPQATRQLAMARSALGGVLILGLALLLTSLTLTVSFLRRLRDEEREELAMLERMGVPSAQLARATLARALLLCGWAAALSSLTLLLIHFGAQAQSHAWGHAWLRHSSPWLWASILAPLPLTPALGGLAGLVAAVRRLPAHTSSSADLRPLLRHDPERWPVA